VHFSIFIMAASIDLPKTQRAIVANDKLDYCIRDDVPLPPLADDCVIIKTEALGLNPVDTKMVGPFVAAGATYGVSSPSVPSPPCEEPAGSTACD
jgi:hypothetical protein